MKRAIIFTLAALLIFTSITTSVFVVSYAEPDTSIGSGVAAPVTDEDPVPSVSTDAQTNTDFWSGNYSPDSVLDIPDVSTEDLITKIDSKGNDIILILQTVGRYLCFFGFIACCILVLIGIIGGNKQMLTGALIGLAVSGVMYAGITCGKEIVQYIAAWARL